jgi:hypothetical protein
MIARQAFRSADSRPYLNMLQVEHDAGIEMGGK